ncbi:MAG: RimK family protein [Balneolales bacterium]|nr:RimK family protein [Balneolales bacterium]
MHHLIVVNQEKDWKFNIPGVEVVSARKYLTDPVFSEQKNVRVYNMSRSYRYQSAGYYVSLLAAARGHRPLPDVNTIQEMKSQTIVRFVSDDLDKLIQVSLASLKSKDFVLSIYFGRNLATKYDKLSRHLYSLFESPLIQARFSHNGTKWLLQAVGPIGAGDVPESHRPFLAEAAAMYFCGKRISAPKKTVYRYSMAILHNPEENGAPSDERALQLFSKAAERAGIECERISRDDYNRLAEFDALFIRETTSVMHHTFRFAQRAEAEGLVVMDDPDSILKCTNKVYLAEIVQRYHLPAPKTLILHKDNLGLIESELGFPCILKQPDSSFSQGVMKASNPKELEEKAGLLLEKSDLIIAQQFMPTEYDWRIGILDRKPLFACRYFMADKHWQIIKTDNKGQMKFGKSETVPWELAPANVIKLAKKAAGLIGDGLYGVDIKYNDGKCYLIEINDNPNMDAGVEDAVLKDELYNKIAEVFLRRIEQKKEKGYS